MNQTKLHAWILIIIGVIVLISIFYFTRNKKDLSADVQNQTNTLNDYINK